MKNEALPLGKEIRLDWCWETEPSRRDKVRISVPTGNEISAEFARKRGGVIKASGSILKIFKKSLDTLFVRNHGFRSRSHNKQGISLQILTGLLRKASMSLSGNPSSSISCDIDIIR
uniref:hypothetical protein n=1 Tax=Enterocloster clostridioformis TaxID=1531 RepID=UPI0025A4CEF3|nr:hypothetical protein [Enterocloster clostridioformis]